MNGTVVRVSGDTLTVSHGKPGKDTTHVCASDVIVTLDDAEAELADLQAGDKVQYSGDPVTNIAAERP